MNVFDYEINSWNDWSRIFRNVETFICIINKIASNHSIEFSKIKLLPAGTNANFLLDDKIIKIYPPTESGICGNSGESIESEIFYLKRCEKLNLNVSRLIDYGKIDDKYCFNYLILSFVAGKPFSEFKQKITDSDKINFVNAIKRFLKEFNGEYIKDFNAEFIIKRVINNHRWKNFSETLQKNIFDYVSNMLLNNAVHVHGDLTEDNVRQFNQNFKLLTINLKFHFKLTYSIILFTIWSETAVLSVKPSK